MKITIASILGSLICLVPLVAFLLSVPGWVYLLAFGFIGSLTLLACITRVVRASIIGTIITAGSYIIWTTHRDAHGASIVLLLSCLSALYTLAALSALKWSSPRCV